MVNRSVAIRRKTGKKKTARKGNGKAAKPGNAADQQQQPEPSASTRWFQMLDSLDLPDLYTLLGSIEKRIGNREAAGEDLVAKRAPAGNQDAMAKQVQPIVRALEAFAAQIHTAADSAYANEVGTLGKTLYALAEIAADQSEALVDLLVKRSAS
jgi:hypothetical protein